MFVRFPEPRAEYVVVGKVKVHCIVIFPSSPSVVVVVRGGLMAQQWDREVVKVKKKDVGATKVGARMLPSGAQKPRRGGWCECCESQYIGTMSEVSRDIAHGEVYRALGNI